MSVKYNVIIGLFIFLCVPLYGYMFTTLDECAAYAERHPEYIDPGNNNWTNPDFTSFYTKHNPNWYQKILHKFGLKNLDWDSVVFKKILVSLTQQREIAGYSGDVVEHNSPNSGKKYIIWGDLYGAFHSFVRTLLYLKDKGIIDNDLQIISDEYHFIFNGNIVNYSPYVLETFTLILRIMEKNIRKVSYIKGYEESDQSWQDSGLARSLKVRSSHVSHEHVPFFKELTRFFNTLPLALLLTRSADEVIRIVMIGNNTYLKKGSKINFKKIGGFLDESVSENRVIKLDNMFTTKKKIALDVIMTAEDRSLNYKITPGLITKSSLGQETLWMSFSAPTPRSRAEWDFFYDAFVIMNIKDNIRNWTLQLINQDIRRLGKESIFTENPPLNIITGQSEKKGAIEKSKQVSIPFKKEKIKKSAEVIDLNTLDKKAEKKVSVGTLLGLSASVKSEAEAIQSGINLWVKESKKKNKNTLINLFFDDQYNPTYTKVGIQQFLDQGVDIFLLPQGSPTLASYLDRVKNNEMLVLFPPNGTVLFRDPSIKNIVNLRASYDQEATFLVDYALDKLNTTKGLFIYQDDVFGKGLLEKSKSLLKNKGIAIWPSIAYESDDTDFSKQIEEIKKINPDTIVLYSAPSVARKLIEQLGVEFFAEINVLGVSDFTDKNFKQFQKQTGIKFLNLSVVPNPHTSEIEIVKEYRDAARQFNAPVSAMGLEAYIATDIFMHIVSMTEGPVTKEKIIAKIESIKNIIYKGLELNFDPQTRSLMNTLWIDTGKGNWEQFKDKKKDDIIKNDIIAKTEIINDPETDIKVGTLLGFSKGIKTEAVAIQEAIDLRIEQAKKRQEKYPLVSIFDDDYNPTKTALGVKDFLSEGTSIILLPSGTATLASYWDKVKSNEVLVLFPTQGTKIFRDAAVKNVVHLRASYEREALVLTKYAIDELNAIKGVFFYQDDGFGKGLLEPSEAYLKQRGITGWTAIPYSRNTTNLSVQVEKIKKIKPDTIVFFGTPAVAQALMRQIGTAFFAKINSLGISDFTDTNFKEFQKDSGFDFINTAVVPNPRTSDISIVREYRFTAQQANIPVSAIGLEAYIGMDIFINILNKVKAPVTHAKIIKELEALQDKDYRGLKLHFDPETRSLTNSIWIDKADGQEWVLDETVFEKNINNTIKKENIAQPVAAVAS